MQNKNLRAMLTAALFSAIIAVSGYISIPLPFSPVPISLQTLAVLLCGLLLTPQYAFLASGLWLLMGTIGLPVFANGTSGIGIVFGPTGGYIFGFVIAAVVISLLRGRDANTVRFYLAAFVGNFLIIYPLGIIGLMLIAKLPLEAAIVNGMLPFIIGDIVKIVAAVSIGLALNKRAKHLLQY